MLPLSVALCACNIGPADGHAVRTPVFSVGVAECAYTVGIKYMFDTHAPVGVNTSHRDPTATHKHRSTRYSYSGAFVAQRVAVYGRSASEIASATDPPTRACVFTVSMEGPGAMDGRAHKGMVRVRAPPALMHQPRPAEPVGRAAPEHRAPHVAAARAHPASGRLMLLHALGSPGMSGRSALPRSARRERARAHTHVTRHATRHLLARSHTGKTVAA